MATDLRKVENRLPNLVNLNEDPQLSEMLIYIIKEGLTGPNPSLLHFAHFPSNCISLIAGQTVLGSDATCEVRLQGVFVRPRHCTIMSLPESIVIAVTGDAIVYVNGAQGVRCSWQACRLPAARRRR